MSKLLTQTQIDTFTEEQMFALIDNVWSDVQYNFTTKRAVDAQITKILKQNGLSDGIMLRRNYDGVTEARWMIKKMIGEFLATGRARV